MVSPRGRSIGGFVLAGLVVCLLTGMVVSNFAASTPDALQRAVINSACADAADQEACLATQEGEPVLQIQPQPLFDYQMAWFSGLVGIIATFSLGTGLVLLLRRIGGTPDDTTFRQAR